MTDIPPPRYRVIERNRRLEVIDTQARRPDSPSASPPPPSPRSMRAGRAPQTSLPRRREPGTRLVIAWSALVVAAIVGVVAFVTMGFGAVFALVILLAGLYQKHRIAIDRWIASLG